MTEQMDEVISASEGKDKEALSKTLWPLSALRSTTLTGTDTLSS